MSEEKLDKGALALQLAYRLVLDAFPLADSEITHWTASGEPAIDAVEGKFWKNVDTNDEVKVKARLQEMAEFIGSLALRLEGKV